MGKREDLRYILKRSNNKMSATGRRQQGRGECQPLRTWHKGKKKQGRKKYRLLSGQEEWQILEKVIGRKVKKVELVGTQRLRVP